MYYQNKVDEKCKITLAIIQLIISCSHVCHLFLNHLVYILIPVGFILVFGGGGEGAH